MIRAPKLTVGEITMHVAKVCALSVKELLGPARDRHVAWPRQAIMAAAASQGHSMKRIGRFLGGRDHTTVLHGVRSYKRRIAAGEIDQYGQEI